MKKSKNKLFGTDGMRGIANVHPMTPEIAMKMGKAIVEVLGKAKGKGDTKIVIGKDTRLSGYMFETALTAGISSMGGKVYLVGPMPTPAIAHLIKSLSADAGIVISASHNPAEDNGIKIFDKDGFKLSDELEEEIENMVLSQEITRDHIKGNLIGKAYKIEDARGRYVEFAKSTVNNMSLNGLKIVLDCANGAAYKAGPFIFKELGADVVELNVDPNGLNINYNCGATHPEVIRKAVMEHNADIGIALDGDADRVIVCDEKGNEVDGDYIMAICALDMLKKSTLNKKTLVATVYSNLALDSVIEKAGGKVVRVKNGDRYVIDEMRNKGYNLGGEFSGHIIFLDYTTTGDGIISCLQLLKVMRESRKKLSELASCLKKYPQTIVSVKVKEKKPFESMKNVAKAIKEKEKALGKDGRVFARYSGTEMLARVMVEGKNQKAVEGYAEDIADQIKKAVGA